MPEPDDITLLRQYAGGNQAAFTTLFERHVHLVYSAALRQVRNPSYAEERVIAANSVQAAPAALANSAAAITIAKGAAVTAKMKPFQKP